MYVDADGNLTSTPPDPTQKEEIKLEDIHVSTPKLSERDQVETERKGFVKFFNEEKRFGFISEVGTREEFFVHEDNVIDPIKVNDKVTFELGQGNKGIVAINVKLVKQK